MAGVVVRTFYLFYVDRQKNYVLTYLLLKKKINFVLNMPYEYTLSLQISNNTFSNTDTNKY